MRGIKNFAHPKSGNEAGEGYKNSAVLNLEKKHESDTKIFQF